MAEIFVQNILNPKKTIKFNLNLRKYVLKDSDGDLMWVLEVGTTELDLNGNIILPKFVNKIQETDIEKEVQKAIASMCEFVDWGLLEIDRFAPDLTSFSPSGNSVPINSIVEFTVEEQTPASGIDLSNMKVILNNGEVDFDITSEIIVDGDPYKYNFKWIPEILYR